MYKCTVYICTNVLYIYVCIACITCSCMEKVAYSTCTLSTHICFSQLTVVCVRNTKSKCTPHRPSDICICTYIHTYVQSTWVVLKYIHTLIGVGTRGARGAIASPLFQEQGKIYC